MDPTIAKEEVRIATNFKILKLKRNDGDLDENHMLDKEKIFKPQTSSKCKVLLQQIESSLIVKWLTKNCDFDFIQCLLHIILLLLVKESIEMIYYQEAWAELSNTLYEHGYQLLFIIPIILAVFYIWMFKRGSLCSQESSNKLNEKRDVSIKGSEKLAVSIEKKGYKSLSDSPMATKTSSSVISSYSYTPIEGDVPILENEWINITTSESNHQLSEMDNEDQIVNVTEESSETKKQDTGEEKRKSSALSLWCMIAFTILIYIIASSSVICVHCLIPCTCIIALCSGLCYCII